jgi:hypothetical protein
VPNPSFVTIVLIDCIRYSALLKTITEVFYQTNGINLRKSEENIYKGFFDETFLNDIHGVCLVITYLIFFQLDSIGLQLLRGFIHSVKLYQMHQVRMSSRV